ncbi:MAG TPA: ATP-binding protein [Thermodesulfovibrionales bacterium]|nr:ATP-binding protein [Thermodesulfovibrionales bacterium]
MKDSKRIISPLFIIERYIKFLVVIWTIIVATSLIWSIIRIKKETVEEARIQAQISYVKDILYRRWNAMHGGVYVPVTEETQPNPYLSGIPERDITTPSGRHLTLMNPAYMTRQVYGLMEEKYGVIGHITSLNPIRPENSPDAWETKALQAFEQGKTEVSSIEEIEGKEYFRFMHRFITEENCLKCHAEQGYHQGDIRGGISVSIPMEPLRAIEHRHIVTFSVVHSLLWLVGLGGIILSMQEIRRSEQERKQAEEELRKKTDELARSNAELEQFASAVSHDLKEPLLAITIGLKLLKKRYEDKLDSEGDSLITDTIDEAIQMQTLISDMLLYSRVGTGGKPFVPTDCATVLNRSLANLRIPLEQSGAVVTHDPLPEVMADPIQLSQLLQNLISNAIKFRGEEKPSIHVSAVRKEKEWVFSVSDNGIGIPAEYSEGIFEIFQRLHNKKEYPGTGIGLATCKKIVERHGGHIWVKSEPDKGSTFYFTIPDKEKSI